MALLMLRVTLLKTWFHRRPHITLLVILKLLVIINNIWIFVKTVMIWFLAPITTVT